MEKKPWGICPGPVHKVLANIVVRRDSMDAMNRDPDDVLGKVLLAPQLQSIQIAGKTSIPQRHRSIRQNEQIGVAFSLLGLFVKPQAREDRRDVSADGHPVA